MSFLTLDPFTDASTVVDPFTVFSGTVIANANWRRTLATGKGVPLPTIDTGTNTADMNAATQNINYTDELLTHPINLSAYSKLVVTGYNGADLNLTLNAVLIGNGTASGSEREYDLTSHTRTAVTQILFDNLGTVNMSVAGAEPHVVCLDNSRLDVYDDGFYRLFEDPETSFSVNIGVVNTFITDICACDRDGVIAHFRFDVDNTLQLHANFVDTVFVRPQTSFTSNEDGTDLDVYGFKLQVQSKYRAVGVGSAKWSRGDVIEVGGILAGSIATVSAFDTNTPTTSVTLVTVDKWDANALSCDAHFPHLVTFLGDQIIPGHGEHTLLHHDNLVVTSTMDHFSRMNTLCVTRDNVEIIRGTWARDDGTVAPNQFAAPKVALSVRVTKDDITEDVNVEYKTGVFEKVFSVGGDDGEILMRMQSNGSASFAIRNIDTSEWTVAQNGLLAQRSSADAIIAGERGSASSSTVTTSIYERGVEPHLAWQRGMCATADTTVKMHTFGLQ